MLYSLLLRHIKHKYSNGRKSTDFVRPLFSSPSYSRFQKEHQNAETLNQEDVLSIFENYLRLTGSLLIFVILFLFIGVGFLLRKVSVISFELGFLDVLQHRIEHLYG